VAAPGVPPSGGGNRLAPLRCGDCRQLQMVALPPQNSEDYYGGVSATFVIIVSQSGPKRCMSSGPAWRRVLAVAQRHAGFGGVTCRRSGGSDRPAALLLGKVLLWLWSQCHRLCPMRPGHAPDDCRHIEIELSSIDVFSCHWCIFPQGVNRLIAADRCDDSEHTDEIPGKDPRTR
jgi:hypothetical protein